jgi:hypothetical protein
MKAQAVEHETELSRKWNLLYVSLRIKTDAVYDRKEVLKRNPNLARRALFGVVMRTEILPPCVTIAVNSGLVFGAAFLSLPGSAMHIS